MEINYITAYKKQIGQGRQEKQSPVFLQIGKKGQKVQGTITGVADMVTLRFDKTEVNVAKSAVKNPVPGPKRQFQIMDVSSEGIVLKEVGDYASDGGDGIKLLDWLVERGTLYQIKLHTANPVGRDNMKRVINRFWGI